MVTRESAIYATDQMRSEMSTPMCYEMSIPADHSTMVKFNSRSNQNYQNVRAHIVQLVKEAPDIIRGRFRKGIYNRCRPEPI